MNSFIFLDFVLYLHPRWLDRSETQFALGTCASSDISSGCHMKRK